MIREIQRHIHRAMQGIRLAFRATLTNNRSGGAMQLAQVQGLAGEVLQDAELMQHYGYTSHPPAGTDCIALPIGGSTAHTVIIATEHGNFRLKNLAAGEVALYTDEGDSIVFKRGRVLEVTTQTLNVNAAAVVNIASPTVNITSPTVALSGNLSVAGTIIAAGNISSSGGNLLDSSGKTMAAIRITYNGHTHTAPNGTTTAPIGQM